MPKHFFVNESTGEKFQIMGLNKETGTVTLKGRLSTIEEPYDKAHVEQMGYKLVTEPDEPAKDEEES